MKNYYAALALVLVSYVVIRCLAWKTVLFSQPRKAIFALTVFPVFLASMFFNIWLTDHLFPALMEAYHKSQVHTQELIQQGRSSWHTSEGAWAFLVSVPLAALITAGWYFVIGAAERRLPDQCRLHQDASPSNVVRIKADRRESG